MAGGIRTEYKCRREVSSSMVIVSEIVYVKRRTEGNGKNQGLFYSVECCRGSQVTRSKKYRCGDRGFDDPDARLKALRFGFYTEGLVAFRNYLFGEGLKVSEGLGRGCSSFVCVRRSHLSGMPFAAVVFRAGNGVIRGVSFAGEEEAAIQRALGFVGGPEFWNWVRKTLGLQVQFPSPGACKHCGQQHQQQEQEQDDTQFGKQIAEDYICSACKKMESGEITIIKMDDQGEYRVIPVEEIWTDNNNAEVIGGEPICTFCGCEDNENFEKMISLCRCNGGSVVAHPSCFFASQAVFRTGGNQVPILCKACGSRGSSAMGVDGKISAGPIEEAFSKPVDLNSTLTRDSSSVTPKKGLKLYSCDLTNGSTGTTEQFENQPPLKRLKGESGRKAVEVTHKEGLSISEPEKLGVTLPVRRFDDVVASVPIKKRKFWPPSPPPASPKAPSPLELSYSEVPVSVVNSGRLSGTEEEQGPLKAHREQQGLNGIEIAEESFQQKSAKMVGDTCNETCEKSSSSIVCYSQDIGSNIDLSGVSTSTMDASMGKLARNSLDLDLEEPVNLKDTGIGNSENPQQNDMCEDTQKHEELDEGHGHVMESNLLPVSQNQSYMTNETPACNSLNESFDTIVCKEMKEETELALGCKSTLVSSNHSEIALGIKVTSEAGECSQHKSISVVKDGQKHEKGMLLRLNSGYFNDDRSHWDLNTPMDSWEKQPEGVDRDPEPTSSGKLPAGNTSDINTENLDGIQVQIFVSDAKHDSRKPEQDMLSKGLQKEQDDYVLSSGEGLALDKISALDMSLSLQRDALLGHHPVNSHNKVNSAFVSKSFSLLDTSVPERDLNLSMAHSELPSELADGISSTEVQDGKHSVENPPVAILEKEPLPQSNEHIDSTMIDVNADALDGSKHLSPLRCEFEPVEDSLEASDLADDKGNLRCFPQNHEFPDCEQKCTISFPEGKQDLSGNQDLNAMINEGMIVDYTHTSDICKVDVGAENVDIPGEKLGSPEAGLDKQSAEYAKEIAYGGDYESDGYDDEDEPVSDAEKSVELAEDENEGEEGEYRETELHDWIEEDVGEELEDEHVDYGDSDFRDADDLGMEQDDKGKDVENERNCDDNHKFEMDERIYLRQEVQDLQVRACGEDTKPETTSAGTVVEHGVEKRKHKSDGIISQSPELLSENKDLEIESNCILEMNMDFLRSREVRLSASSRQKSSGWDQLPEGFESADEAIKAVKEIISKRGRGSTWPTGGRLGPMSARISSARIDAGFRERMTSDDSIHGNEAFFMRGREGNLSTSPSFASRKPTRGRIVGRGGPSRGIHHRGRGDPWGDGSSSHWGSGRHHSPPDYYGSKAGFGSPRSANAAAVSAAKVESSGFLVASDGTVTKITRGGVRGRRGRGTLMGRGSAMDIEETLDFGMPMSMGPGAMMSDTGLNATRGRTITIGPDRIDSGGRGSRERYRGPSFGHSRWDHSIGDSPRRSIDHRMRERNGSFSPPPGRRLTRMPRSHTESRSRSRTRSPRLRSSPRGRAGAGMDRAPAIRRRSRSPPALRSEARIERLKSPIYHRVGSFEHKMSFRTQRTSPQSSKWSYDRRDTGHFRDSDYRRPFVRSGSPRRISPRVVHESSLTESPGRLKHSEYRGSVYSSRASELNSENRRFKHDENEDVRVKQSDISGRAAGEGSGMDVRRFRHQDNEGDCQPRSSCVKDAGISREQVIEDHNNRL